MACSKYTLTNTGSTIVTFNYQRCDDTLWQYQVELAPSETKNIWLVDNTFEIAQAYSQSIILVNQGVFPPAQPTPTPSITPTITPTVTPTASITPTPSITPSLTPTQTSTTTPTPTPTVTSSETPTPTPTTTVTPTVTSSETPTPTPTPTTTVTPTNTRFSFSTNFGANSDDACHSGTPVTIWGDNAIFDNNLRFYNSSLGPVTTDMTGFYSYAGQVVELDSDGLEMGGYSVCASPTPTPTITPTMTQTPTQTIAYWTYILSDDASSSATACSNWPIPSSYYYSQLSSGPGPNIGETLYIDSALTLVASDGYYSNGTAWWRITGGSGQITSSDPNGC